LARRHGWSEEQINDLANFRNRADFTDAEKAALELSERTTLDPNGVDDAFWNELRNHFDAGRDRLVQLLQSLQQRASHGADDVATSFKLRAASSAPQATTHPG